MVSSTNNYNHIISTVNRAVQHFLAHKTVPERISSNERNRNSDNLWWSLAKWIYLQTTSKTGGRLCCHVDHSTCLSNGWHLSCPRWINRSIGSVTLILLYFTPPRNLCQLTIENCRKCNEQLRLLPFPTVLSDWDPCRTPMASPSLAYLPSHIHRHESSHLVRE